MKFLDWISIFIIWKHSLHGLLWAIYFTDAGILHESKKVLLAKASEPIDIIVEGSFTLLIPVDCKAPSQITSVPSLTTYSSSHNEWEALNSFFPSRLYLTPYSSLIAYLKSSSVASVKKTSSIGFSTLFNKNNRNDTADSSCCECAKVNKAYNFENSASFKRAYSDFIIRQSPMSLKSDSENRSESDLALFCNKEESKAIAFRDMPISANWKSSICSLKQSSVRIGWR